MLLATCFATKPLAVALRIGTFMISSVSQNTRPCTAHRGGDVSHRASKLHGNEQIEPTRALAWIRTPPSRADVPSCVRGVEVQSAKEGVERRSRQRGWRPSLAKTRGSSIAHQTRGERQAAASPPEQRVRAPPCASSPCACSWRSLHTAARRAARTRSLRTPRPGKTSRSRRAAPRLFTARGVKRRSSRPP